MEDIRQLEHETQIILQMKLGRSVSSTPEGATALEEVQPETTSKERDSAPQRRHTGSRRSVIHVLHCATMEAIFV